MFSEQSTSSFSAYIRGPFKEKHEQNGQQKPNGNGTATTTVDLVREAENFRSAIQQQKETKGSSNSNHRNALAAQAAHLRKLNGPVCMEVRKTLHGHLSKVSALHWSAHDSRSLVSASQDGKMIVWDTQRAFKLYLIPLCSAWVMSCAFCPTGSFVACGGLDNVCSLYSLHNAEGNTQLMRELIGHQAFVSCCRFLDDRQMLTASGDRKCILWDMENGVAVRHFHGHTGGVMSLALVTDQQQPNTFVTASCDNSAKLWDIRVPPTGIGNAKASSAIRTFAGHSSDLNAIEMFPNGRAFVTGSDDASCKMFDLFGPAGTELATYSMANDENNSPEGTGNAGVTSLAFSKSGRLLFAGYDDFNCLVWDSMRAEKAGALHGHGSRVSCLGVPADGTAICTGSWDKLLKVWN